MQIRERIEQQEFEILSPYALKSAESKGRLKPEGDELDPVRTCFQRDRDRILHSKSFRRLKHKTQVFISPIGDHYRTRLTHTLEVAQIARTIARALRLNEDLTEAIALGHDVGHTPFGHAGEFALDESIKKQRPEKGFRHYEQSARVLSVIERNGEGLNLTHEVLDGILGHSKGRSDLRTFDKEESPSMEAAVVRVADRIAYLNHDLDDALRAGWLSEEDLPTEIKKIADSHSKRIGAMVTDLISSSIERPEISFSPEMLRRINIMKEYLFENFYLEYPKKFHDVRKAQNIVMSLFDYYTEDFDRLPDSYKGFEGAIDYVSGMTDRFAVRCYLDLFVPTDWGLHSEDLN